MNPHADRGSWIPWLILRRCGLFLGSLALFLTALAQTPGEGSVSGTVRNSQTRAFLEGVDVTLDGTSFSTTMLRDGS